MRPISLNLSGFTAFRGATEVDFAGADLFALTGPTGSGKSSIIDAICFALYGSIPRLTGVAPVVSLGMPEARIRLVFEVEGETHTVSRLIVRQGEGASQRDVRLEGPGFVVAGVREVDARIERLLGLGFDHFTRCVVLPQGRFAAFLEDGPAAREKMLKHLLDLGLYEEMRKRGAAHATRLDGEIAVVDAQLHDLLVEPSQLSDAEERLHHLRDVRVRVAEWAAAEEKATIGLAEARQGRDQLVRDIGRLAAVQPPGDLDHLRDLLGSRRAAAEAARGLLIGAEADVARLTEQRTALGEMSALDRAVEAHGRVAELQERLAVGADLVEKTSARKRESTDVLASVESQVAEIEAVVREAEQRLAAHALRTQLADGDLCPVCLQTITALPADDSPADLDGARRALAEASAAREEATARVAEITAELARLQGHLEQITEEAAAAGSVIADLPPREDVLETRERAGALDAELKEAHGRLEAARAAVDESTRQLQEATQAGAVASEALDRARDTLAGLEPPVAARNDPAEDWGSLVAWATARRAGLEARRLEMEAEVTRREEEVEGLRREVRRAVSEAGLADFEEDVQVAVATAIATTEATLARLRADLEKKERLGQRRETLATDQGRYDQTAKLLRSNRFQQWLIEEALVGLVEFANAELAKLSGGAYSLAVEGGEFEVVDHRNAEARRSVRTLSGGETFLVSLALALALAERVVATSAIGTARIESMFLDEGFGTLDAETLDTVASVVQELGARDRMVGLVTHVRELADQIPTRFEVRKLPDGATVTRWDT